MPRIKFISKMPIRQHVKRQVELFYILAPHKHCTYFDIARNSRILYDKANVKKNAVLFYDCNIIVDKYHKDYISMKGLK